MNKKVVSISCGLSMFIFGALGVSAFTSVDGTVNDANTVMVGKGVSGQTQTCVDLKSDNLRYRSDDTTTNGEVSMLQNFLVSGSFLKTSMTGYFGLSTFSAVRQYQRSVGINPTGYVGPLTKIKISEQTCSGVRSQVGVGMKGSFVPGQINPPAQTNSSDGQIINPLNTVMPKKLPPAVGSTTRPVMCTMEARLCPNGTMMPRDPMTCAWLDTKCGPAATNEALRGTGGLSPSGAQILLGDPLPPRATGTQTGSTCTNEVRICSDGKPMVRNMTTCEWVTTSCSTATGTVKVIIPMGTLPTPVPGVVKPLNTPPAVACTMMIRFCPDGSTPMPRDATCGWHPELCTGPSAPVGGLQVPPGTSTSVVNHGPLTPLPPGSIIPGVQ